MNIIFLISICIAVLLLWLGGQYLFTMKSKTLRTKINWLVFFDILVVLVLVLSVFCYYIAKTHYNDLGQRALAVAQTVAEMPEILEALGDSDPSAVIQPITEKLRQQTGADYINVASMSLMNYSDPNPSYIGRRLVGDGYQRVLLGEESISQSVSSLGYMVQAKVPIIGEDSGQRGIVAVGLAVDDIWNETINYLIIIISIGVVGLGTGLVGAYLLSGHVKKQIFNMEPYEIAFLAEEQASVLESIREGIVAVDIEGKITTCNPEAKRLLEIDPAENVIGKHISAVIHNSRLPEILKSGATHLDQPMILGKTLVIVNRIPLLHAGKVIGAVTSFRDKMELEKIDHRLADVSRYVEALRSQRHEFMNRLHMIAGLIRMKEYDLVAEIIKEVNDEQQRVLDFFLARVKDSAVVGILLGKIHRANELGMQLVIDPQSRLQECCNQREIVVTILGNAIENSFEALTDLPDKTKQPLVTVYINDESDNLIIQVRDNGPGISPEIKEHVMEDGVSTKGPSRGFGLALVAGRISHIGGAIAIDSSSEGTTLLASIPK